METLIVCILMEISSGAQSSGRFLELVAAKEDHNICHHPHHHQQFYHTHNHDQFISYIKSSKNIVSASCFRCLEIRAEIAELLSLSVTQNRQCGHNQGRMKR